jgi:hypothetical protein
LVLRLKQRWCHATGIEPMMKQHCILHPRVGRGCSKYYRNVTVWNLRRTILDLDSLADSLHQALNRLHPST